MIQILVALCMAQEAPVPSFNKEQHVYVTPTGYDMPHFGQAGAEAVEQVLDKLHYPFYVIIKPDVDESDESLVRYMDNVVDVWGQKGFDATRDQLFMISHIEHADQVLYRLLVGTRYEQQIGFTADQHAPFLEKFIQEMRMRPRNPRAGIIALAQAVDAYLYENTDPGQISLREARTAVESLVTELSGYLDSDSSLLPPENQVHEYRGMVDEGKEFLDLSSTTQEQFDAVRKKLEPAAKTLGKFVQTRKSERQALENARYSLSSMVSWAARNLRLESSFLTDNEKAVLTAFVEQTTPILSSVSEDEARKRTKEFSGLFDEIEYSLSLRKREAKRMEYVLTACIFFGVIGSIILLIGIFRRRGVVEGIRSVMKNYVDVWREKIRFATMRYNDSYQRREEIGELLDIQDSETETGALLRRTTNQIDGIYARIRAIESHIEAHLAQSTKYGFWSLGKLRDLRNTLVGSFQYDTGVLNQTELFAPMTQQLTIDMSQVDEELEREFKTSIEGWKQLEVASEARRSSAEEHFPHTGLDQIHFTARAHGIPATWFHDHPLAGDAAADQTLYESVNALRWSDPVAYLSKLDTLRAQEEKAWELLSALLKAVKQVQSARVTDVSAGVDTLVLDDGDDPRVTLRGALCAEELFNAHLLTGRGLDKLNVLAKKAEDLYRDCRVQMQAVANAEQEAKEAFFALKSLAKRAQDALENAASRATRVASTHSDSNTGNYLSEARKTRENGDESRQAAQGALDERRFLEATRQVRIAEQSYDNVLRICRNLHAHCDELDRVREAYLRELEAMPRRREEIALRVRRYGGKTSLATFTPPASVRGATQYSTLLANLRRQEDAWEGVETAAKRAYEARVRAERAAAEEAARTESRRRAAASASAWSGGHRSSGGSISSSFSSGHRSSGGSIGGGGHRSSGGRV